MPYHYDTMRETVYCAVCGGTADWHQGGTQYEAAKARGYTPKGDHGAFVAGKVERVNVVTFVDDGTGTPADRYSPGINNGD